MRTTRRYLWPGIFLLLLLTIAYLITSLKRPPRRDYQVTLFDGVTYDRRVYTAPRPLILHTIEIDLTVPGIDFFVTPGEEMDGMNARARTTTRFTQEFGVQVAINGSFFEPFRAHTPWDYYPRPGDWVNIQGVAISGGRQYAPDLPDWPALCIAAGQVQILSNGCLPDTTHALAGNHILIENGMKVVRGNASPRPQPRTAVALSEGGQRLWLVVVDGRQRRYSEGVTLTELADLILELGVDVALNLDGGGSSTLAVSQGRRAHLLNAPIHTNIPMRQRPVGNHFGVYAMPLSE
jgi:hypothetical protein